MAFIIDIKPVEITKLQKKLQKQRDKEARELAISKLTERGIQENPVKRNQFDID